MVETLRPSSEPGSTADGTYSVFSRAQLDLFALTISGAANPPSVDAHGWAGTVLKSYAKVTPDLLTRANNL